MDLLSMAAELAWLIKDNLPCKHLILSAEETFIEFLQPPSSSEDILELEPMVSYHRMLLHRLADIFGLTHESVGEGDGRHLIVERCEDSSIPPVLVSDILEWQYGETQSQQATCQLLKRKTSPDLQPRQVVNQSPSISFEEREAAYLAARERIFSSSEENDEPKEQATPRPRSVPVVARRMIAHALGKRIMADETCEKPEVTKDAAVPQMDEKMRDKCSNSLSPQGKVQQTVNSRSAETQGAAAKQMIHRYLNRSDACSKGKVNGKVDRIVASQEMNMEKTLSGSLRDVIGAPHNFKERTENSPTSKFEGTVRSSNLEILCMDNKLPQKSLIDSAQLTGVSQLPGKSSLGYKPGVAAKRMFAQALGFTLANGSSKIVLEPRAKLGSANNSTYSPDCFEDGASERNGSRFSVNAVQERDNSSVAASRPEEFDSSRAEVEHPSTSESFRVYSKNHSSTGRTTNMHHPGKAAQRMFAQALGIQSLSSTSIGGNLVRNSKSSAIRGLRVGHKPGASSGPSDALNNSLASSSVVTMLPGCEAEIQDYETRENNCVSQVVDANDNNLEATVPAVLDPSEPRESIDPERHSPSPSPKQFREERASIKGIRSFQVIANNTTIKSPGRARHINNSRPVRSKNSNYRPARTYSSDKQSMISL